MTSVALMPKGIYQRKIRDAAAPSSGLTEPELGGTSAQPDPSLEQRVAEIEKRLEAANERLAVGYLPAKI